VVVERLVESIDDGARSHSVICSVAA
jgi:hypothetical protein